MAWTKESISLFDEAMAREQQYAKAQYRAEQDGDFDFAKFAYDMRWKLIDRAVNLLQAE